MLLGENLRRHVLETIDAGLREYHAMLARVSDQGRQVGRWSNAHEVLTLAIKPYYEHVLALAKSGRLSIARDLIPRRPRRRAALPPELKASLGESIGPLAPWLRPDPEDMATWLLNVKERLIERNGGGDSAAEREIQHR